MKKSFILMLSVILTVGMLGCGNTPKQPNPSTGVEKVKIGEYEVTKETNADTVIVDNDTCKITYKGIINSTEINGTKFKLNVVNKTNKKIIIQVDDFSVNGKMQNVTCSIDVLGGKEANDYISEPKRVTITDKENSVEAVLNILNEDFYLISKETVKFDV